MPSRVPTEFDAAGEPPAAGHALNLADAKLGEWWYEDLPGVF
ncbi:MAG TPA: hypothetical protein VEK56_02560 [Vicinamibacterales bacterium]|nr:hypothetical protein [Vicinamibacterales bacterium]